MKKALFLLMTLAISGASVIAQSFDSERVEGFRDLKWGIQRESAERDGKKVVFTKVENPVMKNSFIVEGDEMAIGNVELDRLNYVFNENDRFQKVLLEGKKEDIDEMRFILEYKFGEPVQEYRTDNRRILEWQIFDVKFQLIDHNYSIFGLVIESDFEELEAYRKNTNVSDF